MKSKIAKFSGIGYLIAVFAVGCVCAQDGQTGGGGRLSGTWDAVVTISDCAGGVPITANSIASFNQGGTFIGSTGGIPQSLRTPEHGVWRHVKGNTYAFKFKSFSFLPSGAPNGWSIVEHQLELDSDNNSYASAGTARLFAPNGTQTGQRCSSAVGTRFEL
ncbi:MAG TPA: hypothetical protein VNA17_04795 [Pyrinomonadaceae bacterium]|nr:hypothetical protein [Pyrinomonadaceae bacterium]